VFANQYWSDEQVKAYQTEKLQQLVQHAYQNVPFYTRQFDKLGLKPESLMDVSDLNKLPIIRKIDVYNEFNNFLSINHDKFNPMDRSTGGTTGLAFKFYNDTRSWGLNWATKIRTFTWGGYQYGKDRVAVMAGGSLLPEGRFSTRSRLWRAINNYLVLPITVMTDEIMDGYYRTMIRQKVRFLRGYPSAIYTFAKFLSDHRRTLQLTSVFTTAEMLHGHQRLLLEQVFCCQVFDTYGCGDGMGGANECEYHEGMHINVETSIMQIVDKDGNEVGPGEIGEIVLTALHEYAMPLIRYAPGDLAIKGIKPCSCGRKLPLLTKIVGRTSDLIELSNGRKINGLSIPFEGWTDTIEKFQIVQTKLDELQINIVPKPTTSEKDIDTINKRMQFFAGEEIRIIVNKVEGIPMPKSGKMRYVVSLVSGTQNIA
jgi:phenylacetate-CoA ligase